MHSWVETCSDGWLTERFENRLVPNWDKTLLVNIVAVRYLGYLNSEVGTNPVSLKCVKSVLSKTWLADMLTLGQ